MEKVLIIGETGACAMGDLPTMCRMIEAIAECGADVAKFQWTSNPAKMADRRNAPEYEAIYSRYIAWPRDWHEKLKGACDKAGIEYACTTYLVEDIAVVNPFVKRFKISSFEADDDEFLAEHVNLDFGGKPLIISCGMNGKGYHPAFELLPSQDISHLRCVTAYPAPIDQLNLELIWMKHYDGLSDHTTSILTGAVAVGAGARILEKHVRLHDTPEDNPDYAHSLRCERYSAELDQSQFEIYVRAVREAEKMMGDGDKKIMPCEEAYLRYKVKP